MSDGIPFKEPNSFDEKSRTDSAKAFEAHLINEAENISNEQWKNLQTILSLFRNTPGVQITIYNMDGFPNGVKADCQDEPHLIATDSDEADRILDIWEAGK